MERVTVDAPDIKLERRDSDDDNELMIDDELEEELTRTRLLMETLPPEMIAVGGVLPPGGEVQVGPRVFKRVKAPEKAPQQVSRFGFMYLE